MASEKFIRGKVDGHHHDGRHSITQRLQAAQAQFMDWRRSQEVAHESGHSTRNTPYPENPFLTPEMIEDGYLPQAHDLFIDPDIQLAEVREELKGLET